MIVIHAGFRIDSATRETALDLAADVASASREENGNVDYRVTTDVESPDVLRFVEEWADEDALADHQETAHYRSFSERFPEYVVEELGVKRFDVNSWTELD